MKLTKRQTGTGLAIPLFLAVAKFVSFLSLCYQESIEPPKSVIEKIFYSGTFPNHANDNAFRGKQIAFSDIKIDLALQDDMKILFLLHLIPTHMEPRHILNRQMLIKGMHWMH